jgi:hypothetical protein
MIVSIEQYLALFEKEGDESQAAIRHETAADEIWFRILESHPDLVRAVTLNKNLPESVIRHLAAHEDADVRTDIANKRKLPVDVFKLLSGDKDESVRARLSWNKKTPLAVLKKLADDEEPIVSEPARDRLSSM